jgi:hypothetical protein
MAKFIGQAITVVGYLTGQPWLVVVGSGISLYQQHEDNRRARNKARDAYNASLQDRLEMVDLTPSAARTIVLGRCRTVEGVRRRWASGTNSEKLTMVVSFAGHEIDAFEKFYFFDQELTLDGAGWVLTEPYYKSTLESARVDFTATGTTQTITLAHVPVLGSISATWDHSEPLGYTAGAATVDSVSGASVSLSGLQVGPLVSLTYQYAVGTSTARIRAYTGAAGQNIGADIAAEYPGKITATDAFAGIAAAVVDVLYDPDVYPQGRPTVTALVRGAKVYDPRLDSTVAGGIGTHRADDASTWAWSDNSALGAYHYARHPNGFGLPVLETRVADAITAANVADTPATITVNMPDPEGGPDVPTPVTFNRYTCSLVVATDATPRDVMGDILATMAGRDGWAGGVWRFRAGHKAAASFTIDAGWLMAPIVNGEPTRDSVFEASNGVPRENKTNRVTGQFFDSAQRYQLLPFPAVEDAVLIADEGEYATEISFAGVNTAVQAQLLATIVIRESQAALRLRAQCGLQAYPCELFDVGLVDLPRYGMAAAFGKEVEVVGWRWHPTEGISLAMSETADAIYTPVDELDGTDPAPNSNLPSPGIVEAIEITGITSGTEALTDDSVLTRTRIEWTPAVAQSIRSGGLIELQFTEANALPSAGDWSSWPESGGASHAIIPGLRSGVWYAFRVRAIKPALGVRGPWSVQVPHQIAMPPEVSNASLILLLQPPTGTLYANSDGVVTDFAAAATSAVVIDGATGLDITGTCTFSKHDYGVVSTLSGATLTPTGWDPATISADAARAVFLMPGQGDYFDKVASPAPVYFYTGGISVSASGGPLPGSGYIRLGTPGEPQVQRCVVYGPKYGYLWGQTEDVSVSGWARMGTSPASITYGYRLFGALGLNLGVSENGATGYRVQASFFGAQLSGTFSSLAVTPAAYKDYLYASDPFTDWHFWELTWSQADGTLRLFRDGVLEASATPTGPLVAAAYASRYGYPNVGSSFMVVGDWSPFWNPYGGGSLDVADVALIIGPCRTASYSPPTAIRSRLSYAPSSSIAVSASDGTRSTTVSYPVQTVPGVSPSIVIQQNKAEILVNQTFGNGYTGVNDYTGSNITFKVLVNGVDDSSNWLMQVITLGETWRLTGSTSGKTATIGFMYESDASGTLGVAFTKAGYVTQYMEVPVRRVRPGAPPTQTYTQTRTAITLVADSAGVVPDYTPGVVQVSAYEGGVLATAGYTWAATSVGLDQFGLTIVSSPLTVSTAVSSGVLTATITAMALGAETATLALTGTKSGWPNIVVNVSVAKQRVLLPSGAMIASLPSPNLFDAAECRIRWRSNGHIEVWTDAAGAYSLIGNWYNPTTTGIGAGHYLWVGTLANTATDLTHITGPLNAWTSLASDVEIVVTPATGPVRNSLTAQVFVSASSTGALIGGSGAFAINVVP